MAIDLLILAAFEPELAALRARFAARFASPSGESRDPRVLSIGERSVVFETAGVGLVAAAAGAAGHLAELVPRAVVLVGSCGAYAGSGLEVGDVVVARRLVLADLASLDGFAEFPPPIATRLEADALLRKSLASAAPPEHAAMPDHGAVSVATTLAITVDDATAARIAARAGADVEHLEAHGVATACAARGVPFAAVLGVANFVGDRGRAEWLANHARAEDAAGERVAAWLTMRA